MTHPPWCQKSPEGSPDFFSEFSRIFTFFTIFREGIRSDTREVGRPVNAGFVAGVWLVSLEGSEEGTNWGKKVSLKMTMMFSRKGFQFFVKALFSKRKIQQQEIRGAITGITGGGGRMKIHPPAQKGSKFYLSIYLSVYLFIYIFSNLSLPTLNGSMGYGFRYFGGWLGASLWLWIKKGARQGKGG